MERSRHTLPQMMRKLGITRATAERLVSQYADRLGPVERIGITRCWSLEAAEVLRAVLAEEARLQEQRR